MTKDFAWMLGWLFTDGYIPKKGSKEYHKGIIYFICKHSDKEVLDKIKSAIGTKSKVLEYPDYKSPQAKLNIYDCKDVSFKYENIKTNIPVEDIKGFERHFIRGIIDGDGCIHYRKSRNSIILNIVNQHKESLQLITNIITEHLLLPQKEVKYIKNDDLWVVKWEGNIAKLIVWWLYHGNIDDCCLLRKYNCYKEYILNNNIFDNYDDELLFAVNAKVEKKEIGFNVPNLNSLDWAKRLQNLLSYKTQPIYHNSGKRKYYKLYIPDC